MKSERIGNEEIYREEHRHHYRDDGDVELGLFGMLHSGDRQPYDVFEQRDDEVREQTHSYAVGNAVTERHDDYREECGHRVLDAGEVDILDIAHHEHADVHERARRCRGRNEREKRKQEYREQEEHRGDKRRQTGFAADGHACAGLYERGDRGRTEDCAGAGSDGIGVHALVKRERFALLVHEAGARRAARDRAHGIEHVYHAERHYRHYAEHYGSAAEIDVPECGEERTRSFLHGEEVCEVLPERPADRTAAGERIDVRHAHGYGDDRADYYADDNRRLDFEVRQYGDRYKTDEADDRAARRIFAYRRRVYVEHDEVADGIRACLYDSSVLESDIRDEQAYADGNSGAYGFGNAVEYVFAKAFQLTRFLVPAAGNDRKQQEYETAYKHKQHRGTEREYIRSRARGISAQQRADL